MSLKTITAAVGQNGANIPADVATVQYLLNFVPASNGGPLRKLKVDGFAGVLTIEAINRFQRFHFGTIDSRVESGEKTFGELKKYDPLPFSAASVAPISGSAIAEKMDPSKIDRVIGKSIDGGNIKGQIYSGVRDPSV